jgi:hypothetical protein
MTDEIDAKLNEIWNQMQKLADKRGVKLRWGEFADYPEIVELWHAYNLLASKHGKRPLGWASPEGGWALGWVMKNCKFAISLKGSFHPHFHLSESEANNGRSGT